MLYPIPMLKKSCRAQHQNYFQFLIIQLNIIFVDGAIDRYHLDLSQFSILSFKPIFNFDGKKYITKLCIHFILTSNLSSTDLT